jgi:hypothetical protein
MSIFSTSMFHSVSFYSPSKDFAIGTFFVMSVIASSSSLMYPMHFFSIVASEAG